MMLKLITAASGLSLVSGAIRGNEAQSHRDLSFQKIAVYAPESQVTDHAAIDLDQEAIESQIALATDASFSNAKTIYQNGGHSKSYAEVQLSQALGQTISKGTTISGVDANGNEAVGKAYADAVSGSSVLQIQYRTSDIQESYVNCQVGGLSSAGLENVEGCFASNGTLTVENGPTLNYSYDVIEGNKNGRTIAGFSTSAEDKMYNGCKGCPYVEYEKYYDYYGVFDYANEWVLAALEGRRTNLNQGNNNFSQQTFVGRGEGAKKGTAYMSVWMYVLREFYDAIDDCKSGCVTCNDDPVHAWDEGVAFYAGSKEVPDGSASGHLLHELADKRCANFRTCGSNGNVVSGTAKVNYDLMTKFAAGKFDILAGNCAGAKSMIPDIASKMSVPLIQGTIRYAYKVEKQGGGEKEKAEGAVFAAAILPRVAACDADAASKILASMGQGATQTSFSEVKKTFESQYDCLGVTCADIGGLWNDGTSDYFAGASPCIDRMDNVMSSSASTGPNPVALGLGITAAVVAALACACVGFMVCREKSGNPMFAGNKTGEIN